MSLEKNTTVSKISAVSRIFVFFVLISLSGCAARYSGPKAVEGGVLFSIKAPGAKRVAISGTFNHWDKEMDIMTGPDADGVWSIVIPIKENRIEYLFVIDGVKWILDPEVPFVDDGLGGKNSVFEPIKP